MASFSSGRGQGLTLFLLGDATQLDRTLKKSAANVSTFSRKVEVEGRRASAATGGLLGGGVGGRQSSLNQGLRGGLSGFGARSSFLFGSGAFIGASAAVASIKGAVDAASNLNEQITKSQAVFKSSDAEIEAWSKNTAKNIGISREAALEAAGTFGNLFKAQGFGNFQNSQLSKGLVQLAADLASFNNVDPKQVLQDLASGLVGQIEPVRKYGVDLRIANVNLEALAETGKDNVKQLTNQEKTLARIHLIYQQTAAAQGDFQRTSSGLANQQRILKAEFSDAAAKLGTLLLPAVVSIVQSFNGMLIVVNKIADALSSLGKIKIPVINLPLKVDFGGGGGKSHTITNIKNALTKDLLVGGLPRLIYQITHGELSPQKAEKIVPKTAAVFSDFLKNVLTKASQKASPGVSFGDLLGNVLAGGQKPLGPTFSQKLKSLVASLNLKLDKAGISKTLSDDLAVLQLLKSALQKEIKSGVDVANAKKGLIAVEKQIQQLSEQRSSDAFSKFIDSLNLGVEKAGLTVTLNDDLAALYALKAGLEKQIKAGVDVASAQHQLVSVEAQIAQTQQQARDQRFADILSALQLGVDKAALTKGLNDDLKALEALRDGLKAQIAAGQDVANNQSQLVSVIGEIKSVQSEIAQKTKTAQQGKLFSLIGLSATGGEIIPGVANLKKQFAQLTSQDLSGVSRKLTNRLAGVAKALVSPFLKAQPEVRSAIADLFKAIRDELDKQNSNGPLTKTTSLNTNKILKGVPGIDPAATKELRSRLSKFNSGGVALATSGVAATRGGFPVFGGTNVNVDVTLDGQSIAKSVTITQQKRANRNPSQTRGPIAGRI